MKKLLASLFTIIVCFALLAACATPTPVTLPMTSDVTAQTASPQPADTGKSGMPARPGSDATGDPSGNLTDLVEASGTVKEVKEGLVLITAAEGGDFMLRFSENSKWADGIDTKIEVGNKITCLVKLEPTFAPPSQGEVYKVTENSHS